MGKIYTKDEIRSLTEDQFAAMSKEEKIDFVAQADVMAREEVNGHCLTSITVGQMLYETGFGNGEDQGTIHKGTYNIIGLIGYPYNGEHDPSSNLVKFDNYYDCIKAHQMYFDVMRKDKGIYGEFIKACDNGNYDLAVQYMSAYDLGHENYIWSVQRFVSENQLRKYDEPGIFTQSFSECVTESKTLDDLMKRWDFANADKNDPTQVLTSDLCLVTGGTQMIDAACDGYTSSTELSNRERPTGEAAINGNFYAASDYMKEISTVLVENTKVESESVRSIAELIYEQDVAAAAVASDALSKSSANSYLALANLSSNFTQKLTGSSEGNITRAALGETIFQGKVGKISASDIASTASNVLEAYAAEKESAKTLSTGITAILDSIGVGNALQGESWDAVKANLTTYSDLMELRENAAETLENSTKAAMQLILNYMDGRSEIDDSQIPEIKADIARCKTDIANLQAANEQTREVCESYFDIWSRQYKESCHTEYVLSDGQRATNENLIHIYEDAIVAAEKEVAYLEGFAEVVNKAQQMMNDAIIAVGSAFASAANAIQNNESFNKSIELDTSVYENYLDLISTFNNNLDTLLASNSSEQSSETTSPESTAGSTGGSGGDGGGGGSTPTTTPSSTAPSTTTPETTAPGTTAPSTTTPDTTAPDTTSPSETAPSTTVPSETNPQSRENITRTSSRRPYTETRETSNMEFETPREEQIERLIFDEGPKEPIEDYSEPIVVEPSKAMSEPQIITNNVVQKSKANIKTLGVASGVGLAIGAAAIGAHAIIKAEEEKQDDEEDYGYNK